MVGTAPEGANGTAGDGDGDGGARVERVLVVLLDSLNRHHLGAYGSTEFATPNLDRFAADAVRFTNHYAGSLPCIPARHDLLVGALDFLWRPWGSIEVWEDAITHLLRREGVTTHLFTDHPHLFETGGENYHTDFGAWAYLRGHESDPWRTRPDPSAVGAPLLPPARETAFHHPYDDSRSWFRGEDELPGPATMAATAAWLAGHGAAHDRWFVLVDEFDPHEPFDTPEPGASRYGPAWEGPRIIWPPYAKDAVASGVLSAEELAHLRGNYGAKLSMIDHWFGRILDALDAANLWSTTAVVVCTDHGHYLGERDLVGKPGVPLYEPMVHTPLFVRWPGVAAGDCDALTTSVDLFATLCDVFGVTASHPTHGTSLLPLLRGDVTSVREWLLAGVWGREVHVIGDGHKFVRSPVEGNRPLSMWSNRWSTMPITAFPSLRLPRPDRRATLDYAPGTDVPVIRQPFQLGDLLPYWAMGSSFGADQLYDLAEDPAEAQDLAGGGAGPAGARGVAAERAARERLRAALDAVAAPDDQFARLGLA